MADRYWILGTGTWDSTTTTNWSATSGGIGGASVPTASDNVFFDANSNVLLTAFTCTMANTPRVCNDFTASGLDGVMTLAGTSIGLTVSGSLTFQATNFTRTYTGTTTFNATTTGKTVTTNGVAFGADVTFNGVGGDWTLGSALAASIFGDVTVTNGTFDTSPSGNYAVTCRNFLSSNSNVRTINLNASTVNLSSNTPVTFTTSTNLTFNAGTSTINCTNSSITFTGGGFTYYNVAFTSTSLLTVSITGANTFNDLSVTGITTIGIGSLSLSANQTINGTFTVSAGTASAYRRWIYSNTSGTVRTLTCAAVSLTDTDFRDITIAGAASPASGTRLGNAKNNSGITFDAAKTVYYGKTGSSSWGTSGSGSWSATSGGALDATMFPLAQDTAVYPAATYPASGSTTTINDDYNIGTIDMSLRTSNTMTLNTSTSQNLIFGNWINGTGITSSTISSTLTFAGRTTQTITSAGVAFPQNITIDSPSGTVTLQDALTTSSTKTTTLTSGTLALQSYTLSTGYFNSTNSNTRTIAFGTGSITCTKGLSGTSTVWTTATATGLTTTGTQVVNVTSTGSTAITVNTGVLSEANSISFNFTGGTYALAFLQANADSACNVDFTGYAGTWGATSTGVIYGNLTLASGMTLTAITNAMRFGATSGTKTITSNTKTMDFPVTFNGIGGTWACQDALTLGSTRALTMTNGTLQLKDGVTSTVGSFVTSGTTLKYLQSTTSGVQATLSDASGTNTVTYLSIQDSNATGGAAFNATSVTNVNAGNNSGWSFIYAADITETATATDSLPIVLKILNTFVSETATATDVFIPSNIFWDIINNSQTITWTPTPTNTSTTWSLIDDSQTITWTPTPTNTSTTWVLVDDTAPTTWQNINN